MVNSPAGISTISTPWAVVMCVGSAVGEGIGVGVGTDVGVGRMAVAVGIGVGGDAAVVGAGGEGTWGDVGPPQAASSRARRAIRMSQSGYRAIESL
ncbi:MAG: hypothetical protein Kow00124_01240 [Anaerolineae bacterium]